MRSDKEFLSAVMERREGILKKRRSRIRAVAGVMSVFAAAVTVLSLRPWQNISTEENLAAGNTVVDVEGTVRNESPWDPPELMTDMAGTPIAEDIPDPDEGYKDETPIPEVEHNKGPDTYGETGVTVILPDGGFEMIEGVRSAKVLRDMAEAAFDGDGEGVFAESVPGLLFTLDFGDTYFEFFSDGSVRKDGGERRIIGEDEFSEIEAVIEKLTAG